MAELLATLLRHRTRLPVVTRGVRVSLRPPRPRAGPWPVPPLATQADLARLIGETPACLDWLADLQGRNGSPHTRTYRYTWVDKAAGGKRLIEAPKIRLKLAQKEILKRVLQPIPVHDAATGFVLGRGVLDHARRHQGRRVVVTLDLRHFFWGVRHLRVRALFAKAGYRAPIARRLTALCTTTTPKDVLRQAHPERRPLLRPWLDRPHLAQGAPTSPALSNLVCFRLDARLSGLARHHGATYSRYADDLAFSLDKPRRVDTLLERTRAIVRDEGFEPHPNKTRIQPDHQRQEVCGLVVNERATISRASAKRLEATLYNAIRGGVELQNREGHPAFFDALQGRVAWMAQVDPIRARRVVALWQQLGAQEGRSDRLRAPD